MKRPDPLDPRTDPFGNRADPLAGRGPDRPFDTRQPGSTFGEPQRTDRPHETPSQQGDPLNTTSPTPRGNPFETGSRQGHPLDPSPSASRRFGAASSPPSRPFEASTPQSRSLEAASPPDPFGAASSPNRPFEATTPPGLFEAASSSPRPFEPASPPSRPFESPAPQSRSSESSRPQGGAYGGQYEEQGREEQRSERRPGKEKPLSRPPMERHRQEPEPGGRRSRAPIFVVGGVLALIAAVVTSVVIMSNADDPAGTTASPTGAAQPPAQVPLVGSPNDKYGYTASRKTDPQPLTLNELFGKKKVTTHGRSYAMTVRRSDKKCKDAVHGTGMQKALSAGQCTQFLRASFRDGPGKLIGTIGVANLKTTAAAKKAAKTGTGGELEDYVNPLQGKDAATKLLGSGGDSYATAWYQGHYLVLLWFQYKDGHKPSKTELKSLNRAAVDITEKSVFTALDTRALTGSRTK
ncbi:hypothetical protein ACFO8L_30535 [Sphaerisporangium corydalis]|uniref:Uncharacterized protein n=1 Tax=Sphaerisporangium corydalis TaxID=1441875 RepID=A0ABV9EPF6_9ACTN